MKNDELVLDNINLVHFLLKTYYPTFSKNEDVVQNGILGLCKAVDTFDESKGIPFSAYASKCIMNSIRTEIRNIMKYRDTLSLDYEYNDDGENITFGEYIEDEDSDLSSMLDIKKFVITLDDREKDILQLKTLGYSITEIQKMRDYGTRQNIDRVYHKILNKWRDYSECIED